MTTNASKRKSALSLAAITGALIALASLTEESSGAHHLSVSESEYCEMHAMWSQDKKRGFAEEDRRGWPDFKGTASTLCAPTQTAHGQQLASR